MKTFAILVALAACGPQGPQGISTGTTAPGGIPGTPNRCCCTILDRGLALTTPAQCYREDGRCLELVSCEGTDTPSAMN